MANDLKWETINPLMKRVKVPGGWLVLVNFVSAGGITFYPDPNHIWDGSALDGPMDIEDSDLPDNGKILQ